MKNNEFSRYLFPAMLLILIIISFLIIRSYAVAMITGFIFAYIMKPLHNKIKPVLGNTLSAGISSTIVLAAIILPGIFIAMPLLGQAYHFLSSPYFQTVKNEFLTILPELNFDPSSISERIIPHLFSFFTSSLPGFITFLFVCAFTLFYSLKEWDSLIASFKKYLPIKSKDKVLGEIKKSTDSIIYGNLIIGVIEFIIATLALYLAGSTYSIIFAFIIFILAFVPGGPALVWTPLAIYYFIEKSYFSFSIILIAGIIISVGIDTLLRVKITGEGSNIHPLVMLVGILGGVPLFGIFGLIIGPLIVAYTLHMIDQIYDES
jgi:predicted PurR-regulated permease PerM